LDHEERQVEADVDEVADPLCVEMVDCSEEMAQHDRSCHETLEMTVGEW
jgi:hypothetical protein